MLNNKTTTGLLVLGLLGIAAIADAQPAPMNFPGGRRHGPEPFLREGPSRDGGGIRKEATPGRILGRLLHKYDLDRDGILAGLELSNAALDLVVQRPPCPPSPESMVPDLRAEATALEERLLRDFDLDEDGAISTRELIIALEAIKPPPGPRGHGASSEKPVTEN